MESPDEPRPDAFRGDLLFWGASALLFLSLILGGGGAETPALNGLLQAGGGLLLCATFASFLTGRPPPAAAAVPVILLVVILLLTAAQLVPLPPSWWIRLHGREAAAAAYRLAGEPTAWRPLSLDPEATRRFAASLLLPAGLFLAALRTNLSGLVFMARIIVAGALISAMAAAAQLALGLPAALYPYGPPGAGVPTGLFANPNHLAQLMLAGLVLSGLLIRFSPRSRSRGDGPRIPLSWLLFPIFVVGAVATQSRAGIILIVPAALAAISIAAGGRRLARIFGLTIAALGALVVIALLVPGAISRGMELQSDISAGGRIANFPDILFTMQQFWPWGSGFGTFVPVFKANENLDLMGNLYLNHAHNDLLELLIEGGLPIALVLLAGLLAMAGRLWRWVAGSRSTEPTIALAGLTIIVIAMIHSLVDYPLRMSAIAAVAAIAVALFVAPLQPAGTPGRVVLRGNAGLAKCIWASLLLLGLLLGVQSIRMGLGESAVRARNGLTAAAIRPQNGWGLALFAERQLELGHADQAAQTSRVAIERAPLAVVAIRTLARAEEKLHGPGAGENAWQAASLLGWRDKPTQVWAALRALSNGQAEIFAMRADALLRIGDPDELMTRFIRQAVVEPRIRQAFVARLATNPPWRTRFFQAEEPPTGQALDGVVAVLHSLAQTGAPPTRQELRDAIRGLIAAGRTAEAVALDRRFIRRIPDPGSLLDDGGFERGGSDYQTRATPFDWAIDPRSAEVDSSDGQRRMAVFATGSPDPALLRFVAVPAGHYRLQFAVSGPPDTGPSLRLAAECTASGGTLGTSPQQPLTSEDWQDRSFDFNVPPGCGLVKLTVKRSRPGSSNALIDDVRLLRI